MFVYFQAVYFEMHGSAINQT